MLARTAYRRLPIVAYDELSRKAEVEDVQLLQVLAQTERHVRLQAA